MSDVVTRQLLASLCRQAGRGTTNRMSRLTLCGGRHLILREYQWPWASPDSDRPRKELFLHDLLQQGVPVPTILATAEVEGRVAALMDCLPGRLLGEVTLSLLERERTQAWRSCGDALRRTHAIRYPRGTYGVIVGD